MSDARNLLPALPARQESIRTGVELSTGKADIFQGHKTAKQRRHRHSPQEWEAQKEFFIFLYIETGLSLETVIGTIQRERNFEAR